MPRSWDAPPDSTGARAGCPHIVDASRVLTSSGTNRRGDRRPPGVHHTPVSKSRSRTCSPPTARPVPAIPDVHGRRESTRTQASACGTCRGLQMVFEQQRLQRTANAPGPPLALEWVGLGDSGWACCALRPCLKLTDFLPQNIRSQDRLLSFLICNPNNMQLEVVRRSSVSGCGPCLVHPGGPFASRLIY